MHNLISFVKLNSDGRSAGGGLTPSRHMRNHPSIYYWLNIPDEVSRSEEFLPNLRGRENTHRMRLKSCSAGTEESRKKRMRMCKRRRVGQEMSQPLKQVFVSRLWSGRKQQTGGEKDLLLFLSVSQTLLPARLWLLLRLFFFFFFFTNYQKSNQDIGDPAATVMRPRLDGIKSNASLMPL